jgi:predicted peroxiredoxin
MFLPLTSKGAFLLKKINKKKTQGTATPALETPVVIFSGVKMAA